MSKVKDALCVEYVRCPDLTGMVFGRLTVVERAENDQRGNARWLCECSCGSSKKVIVPTYCLRNGNTTSCGCYHTERIIESATKHGASHTRLWKIWSDLKQRCTNPNATGYKNWGGRGIGVCPEWTDEKYGFENFQRWAIAAGYNDSLTIERNNVNENYEPNNCRWATAKEQQNNRTNNHFLEFNGKRLTLAQWSDETGIPYRRLAMRIRRGWSVERALTEPKVIPNVQMQRRRC